jgi:hypothetical protein
MVHRMEVPTPPRSRSRPDAPTEGPLPPGRAGRRNSFLKFHDHRRPWRWGTFGTFQRRDHSRPSAPPPGSRGFVSARLEAIHHLALVTIVASQVLQLIGSVALWRRRLLGRTLLLTYAAVYLAALILVQAMRAIDEASTHARPVRQHASCDEPDAPGGLRQPVPAVPGDLLTPPWIVRLLARKGEPLPVSCAGRDPQPTAPSSKRRAA